LRAATYVAFRKITSGFRTDRGGRLHAGIGAFLATARRRAITAREATRLPSPESRSATAPWPGVRNHNIFFIM
jgi:hypothetical protein